LITSGVATACDGASVECNGGGASIRRLKNWARALTGGGARAGITDGAPRWWRPRRSFQCWGRWRDRRGSRTLAGARQSDRRRWSLRDDPDGTYDPRLVKMEKIEQKAVGRLEYAEAKPTEARNCPS